MNHRTDLQVLRMCRHSITSQEDNNTRDKVPLGATIPTPTQPHTQKTSAPPNNPHSRMLEVIMSPRLAPAVFGEGVNTAPKRNDQRIEELLTAAGTTKPELADEQKNGEQDSVRNERAAHDEVSETLAKVILATESHHGNPPEEHLRPANDGHSLAKNPVGDDNNLANPAMDSPRYMQLQIHT